MTVVVQKPRAFHFAPRLRRVSLLLVGMGTLAFVLGLLTAPERAWANFLVDYYFWLCIGLAGIFFAALQHITGATWSIPVRRVAEVFSAYLPVAAVLFVVLLFGLQTLYEWTDPAALAHDPLLHEKAAYLNIPFFVVRHLLLLGVVGGAGWWMVRNSTRQDMTGDGALSRMNVRIAAPFLILFAWLFSFVSIDLLMSLSPHWFSTIFGVYCWAGLFYSGLAMLTVWVIALRRNGCLAQYVSVEHYHGLGKFMWAFVVFWAYIAFSQFMLIWYANLPEETPYLLQRVTGPWRPVSMALMIAKFWLPFFLIISQKGKRSERWLFVVALWFLAAQWLDVYWLVFPTFFATPCFGWMEIGMFGGFAGLFLFSVGTYLQRVAVVAYRDPQIVEGMSHHQ